MRLKPILSKLFLVPVIAMLACHSTASLAQNTTTSISAPKPSLPFGGTGVGSSLFGSKPAASNASGDPLDPEVAFKLSASRSASTGEIAVRFDIANGYYLYAEKIKVTATGGAVLQPYALPKGEVHFDPIFNKNLETFRRELSFNVRVDKQPFAAVRLTVQSQGCADIGICYPPQTQTLDIPAAQQVWKLVAIPPAQPALATNPAPQPPEPAKLTPSAQTASPVTPPKNAQDSADSNITRVLTQQNTLVLIATFIGFGLLLAFTPCVLPMVPIVSAIVVGQGGGSVPRWRGLALSAAYVLGMALVYTAVGVAAGLLGQGLAAALQNVWVIAGFALLMVVLAGAQFDWYELQLPQRWTDALNSVGGKRGGGYIGAALMGALSALMVGPCVTAPLAATLSFIAQTGQAVTGGVALFSLAIGMGIPLLAIGAGGGALLPKAGAWMNTVKHAFGILLLGVALWMVQPFIPLTVSTGLWVILLVGAGWVLGALNSAPSTPAKIFKLLGIALLLWAAAVVWGMAGGRYDVLQPLAGKDAASVAAPAFERIDSPAQLAARLEAARGTPVMLDFYADWCVSCIEMERYTFTDPAVAKAMGRFVRLKVDVTQNTADHQALLKQFGLFGPPGLILYDAQGQEQRSQRVIGFVKPAAFLAVLSRI